jgi:pilus assembly protein CpaB
MIGFAVVFGILAVFVAQVWLNNQANKQARTREPAPVATRTIVVAKEPLRFGATLTAKMLREVPWPANAMPAGAFARIKDVLGQRREAQTRRISLKDLANGFLGNDGSTTTVVVMRPKSQQSYTVPVEGKDGLSAMAQAPAGQGPMPHVGTGR